MTTTPCPDIEHLDDHVQLYLAKIEARARLATGPADTAVDHARAVFQEAHARITAREAAPQSLAAREVAQRLGLSATEMHVVWLLATLAINTDARALLPRATGEATSDPTLAGISAMVYGRPCVAALQELAASGPLRRLGVIERSDTSADAPEPRWTWSLSARMLQVLHGQLQASRFELASVRTEACRPGELAVSEDAVSSLRSALGSGRAAIVVAGSPASGRRTLVTSLAHERGIAVLEIDARRLAKDPAVLARQLRACALECKLLGRVPLIANLDALVDDQPATPEKLELVGRELVAQLDGLVLATCGVNRPAIRWDRPTIAIDMGRPSSQQIAKLWARALGPGSQARGELLAERYPLAPALIQHAAAAAKARAAGERPTPEEIRGGIRSVLDDRLGQFARRVSVTQGWDDLVLPTDQLDAIIELMARVRSRSRVYDRWGFGAKVGRGLGVTALLSGPPGTGKTMVAALIAQELGLELYQVDLGKVVSKWIGETEKNLGALFDAAEAGHAILLFDEADALFGKRTEVKSSNDRHANLETNYLLQRLETYTGICLLTSNHERAIDPAFQRRLSLHLRFEMPDADERAQLWRAMLPTTAPTAEDIDFERLAERFVMAGGYIRNAALRAAFLAADGETPITAAHLEYGARREYEGLGRLVV